MDKHIAVPAVDISGSRALWLAARGASLQLVRRLRRVAAKRTPCVCPANMGEVRRHSFITVALTVPPSEPTGLEEAEPRDNAYVTHRKSSQCNSIERYCIGVEKGQDSVTHCWDQSQAFLHRLD